MDNTPVVRPVGDSIQNMNNQDIMVSIRALQSTVNILKSKITVLEGKVTTLETK